MAGNLRMKNGNGYTRPSVSKHTMENEREHDSPICVREMRQMRQIVLSFVVFISMF